MTTIEDLLLKHEGLKFTPYRCSAGKLSIGVGRNLDDKGISKEEAMLMLFNDIDESEKDLANNVFKGQFYNYPKNIQLVLIDMRFQLGQTGFRKFKKMIMAFENHDYQEAIAQMKDSKWYDQVTKRAEDLIGMIKEII